MLGCLRKQPWASFFGSTVLDTRFFEFEEFQYTRRSSLLDSTVNRWTRYSSFSSKIDFHRVTEFYSKYSTLKHARITSNIEFKVTRKSSTRLAIFKSFPDSVLDSTRFDFCRGGVPIGKLAHGCPKVINSDQVTSFRFLLFPLAATILD